MKLTRTGAPLALVLFAFPAFAQPVVDGSIVGDPYGPPVSVQAVQTGFGDNASELNAAYCYQEADRLYLVLTGNIEANFNKLEVFIDSRAGGENVLSGMPGNDFAGNMTGFSFDAGFEADFHLIARRGNFGTDVFDLDYAELGTPNFSFYGDLFGGSLEGSGVTGTGANGQPIEVGYDNSNVAGVMGGDGPADQVAAAAVQTGFEVSIALSDLGYTGGTIKVCAFVNNGDHNFASNQFLGPLAPPQGNLGGDGSGNFTGVMDFSLASFPGDQYFVCLEEPVSVDESSWGRIKAMNR